MTDTQNLQLVLNRWTHVQTHWNDTVSREIEQAYLNPIRSAVQMMCGAVADIDDFTASIAYRLAALEED